MSFYYRYDHPVTQLHLFYGQSFTSSQRVYIRSQRNLLVSSKSWLLKEEFCVSRCQNRTEHNHRSQNTLHSSLKSVNRQKHEQTFLCFLEFARKTLAPCLRRGNLCPEIKCFQKKHWGPQSEGFRHCLVKMIEASHSRCVTHDE